MSTQRMRDVLSKFRSLAHGAQWNHDVVEEHHSLALAEVDAIERAARSITSVGGLPAMKTGMSRAEEVSIGNLMRRISEDAP